jgi:hypothetical protein
MKNKFEFGSIRWAFESGRISREIIREIADGDYQTARSHFDFYSDGRSNRGAAMTARKNAAKLYHALPSYHAGGMIHALCWIDSLSKGEAIYKPMRNIGETK